jgi:hypothetical protein
VAAATTLAVLAAAGLAGCGTPHPGLSNGSVSACYRALPVARKAVNDTHADLIGVHRVPIDKVSGHLPAAADSALQGEDDTSVCAVAFKGTFAAGQVLLAPPSVKGTYAVVLVGTKHLNVVASAVLDHLPHFLGKRTL